jgi:ATP sulfurylase
LEECYTYDLEQLAGKWFGTTDSNHPGVAGLMRGSSNFLAGKVDLVNHSSRSRNLHELTPAQTRVIFERLQWQRVVGFHTRNVAHRAHEHLQLTALVDHHADGVFIHPVIGPKKTGDFSTDIILKTYQHLIVNHYPQNKVVLGGFATYARYAGPREAVFTALCRKNFGCSHFIVGRDHTGVGDFYPADASQRLFDELGDMVIQPIFFDEVYYCQKCMTHVEQCGHGRDYSQKISGTLAREMLSQGQSLPEWYMRPSVSSLILEELKNGGEVFTA